MRSGADLRGGWPLVSFDHVIDPHFVTFPAVCIQQSATRTLTLTLILTLTLTIFITVTLTVTLPYSDH